MILMNRGPVGRQGCKSVGIMPWRQTRPSAHPRRWRFPARVFSASASTTERHVARNVEPTPPVTNGAADTSIILDLWQATILWTTKSASRCITVEPVGSIFPIRGRKMFWTGSHSTPETFGMWLKATWSNKDCPCGKPHGACGATTECLFPSPLCKTGLQNGGEKVNLEAEYLPEVLENFSGYLAVDEVYDGPFCILVCVDAKHGRRLAYKVLDEQPTKDHMEAFLGEVRARLAGWDLKVRGITTDGSPLYPGPIQTVFPGLRHQVCVFHIFHELNRLILKALMRIRRELKGQEGKPRRRGRPSKREAKKIKRLKRLRKYIKQLRKARGLWIKKKLTRKERQTLNKLARGRPVLRRLRQLVEMVHALFDRRCRTQTARRKLEKLRKARFFDRFPELEPIRKKLMQPTLERALECLDDRLLERTSNSVERSNRRFRKMQGSIYRARTKKTIEQRINLDLLRDLAVSHRIPLLHQLHEERALDRAAGTRCEHNDWAVEARRKRA